MKLSSTKLTREVKNLISGNGNYSAQVTKWAPNTGKTPHIETVTSTAYGKVNSSYSKRLMDNGDSFEVLQCNDQKLQVIKNKYGEFTAHKANFKIPLDNVARVYENTIDLIHARVIPYLPNNYFIH